jgi:isopenicillin N synthase-like dioxygenase
LTATSTLLSTTNLESQHKNNMGSLVSDRCADLKAISLVKLLAGDSESAQDLVQACKGNGFFYLDFRHPSTSRCLQQVDELIGVGNAVFSLPLEEKEDYSTEKYLPSRLLGYALNKPTKSCTLLTPNTATNVLGVQSDLLRRRKMGMRAFR